MACTASKKESSPSQATYSPEEDMPVQEDQKKQPILHIIEIKQMKFQPSELKVHKGDQVIWINKDITDHDITEQSSKAWASSPLSTGETWSMTVMQSADYYCNLHQVMKGRIVVE